MNPPRRQHYGFTLLELLVALAIFAVAALGALKHGSQSLQQQQRLVDKTLALWLAENHLAELRLTTPWPATGTTELQISAQQRQWRVTTDVTDTPVASLRKVLVTVDRDPASSQPLAELIGYLGEH